MKGACLTIERIATLVAGLGTAEEKHHIRGCPACRRWVTILRQAGAADLDNIAEILDEVEDLVQRLLVAPRSAWWKIVRQDEYQDRFMARRLLTGAIDARFKDRELAVALAEASTTILDALDDPKAEDLRFEAWKFTSAILREAGRYAELPRAFLKAAEAAQATTNPVLASAAITLSRALYYSEPDVWKPKKATVLLDRAEAVFARYDPSRLYALHTARAMLLFRAGDLPAARDAFALVLAATPCGDRTTYLYALVNVMWVRVELGEAGPEIEQTLTKIIAENETDGQPLLAARTRWMMAKMYLRRGEYDAAAELLTHAMTSLGDRDSSIRCGLDAIQALLLGERVRDAYTLARELAAAAVELERSHPSRRHDLTTQVFAYLHEAAQRQALTADLVTECAHYLDRIARQRPFEFIPPMPLTEM